MDNEKKDARLHIRIEPSLLTLAKQAAKKERLPFAVWLRRLLEQMLHP